MMNTQDVIYLFPYIVAIAVQLAILWHVWQHRDLPGAPMFALYVAAQTVTVIAYMGELSSDPLTVKHLWDDIQWIYGIVTVVAVPLFVLRFTEHKWSNRGIGWILFIVPVLFTGLVATTTMHGLVRLQGEVILGEPFSALSYEYGPVFWIFVGYAYLVTLASIGLLIRYALKHKVVYRRQAVAMIMGLALPLIGSLLPVLGIQLTFQRDIQPAFYAVGNVIIAWGVFRYHLFDLVPVAQERVLATMAGAVIVLDREHRIVDLNPAAERLFDVQAQAVIGKLGRVIFDPWPEQMRAFRDVRQATTQLELTTDSGETRYLDLSILPLHNDNGAFTGRLLVLNDVTTLVEARQKAEQADRVKSQFLASMSHELRTPLNAIINFTDVVLMEIPGPLNERQHKLLGRVSHSSRHLLALINDVLDISKMEAGSMSLLMEQVDLAPEVAAVIDTVKGLMEDTSIALVLDIDQPLPTLCGDRRRIRQILLNLLSNACKFTEAGSITFSIKVREDHVLFAVIDTGPGIPLEQQERIFEPFTQTETGIQHSDGTGLGLPITKRLVEAHDGQIWVESDPGDGAAFFVKLPREDS